MDIYADRRLTTALTYSGGIPFIGLAGIAISGVHPAWAIQAFIGYGAVIVSFMAGAVWTQTQLTGVKGRLMLIGSNIAALAAFAALISGSDRFGLALQPAAFLLLLAFDWIFAAAGRQPAWYFVLRRNITGIVLACYASIALLA